MRTISFPKHPSCLFLLAALCASASEARAVTPPDASTAGAQSVSVLAALPLFFESSATDASPGSFVARGQNCQVVIEPASAQILLTKPLTRDSVRHGREMAHGQKSIEVRAIRMDLLGAQPTAGLKGSDAYTGRINDFSGDRSQWRTQIPMWSRVQVTAVYPGIDLVYYGNQQELEYDFCLEPGTDPSIIRLKFSGVDSVEIDPAGELVLKAGQDIVRQHRPVIYQVVDGRREIVRGGYEIRGRHLVGFNVGSFRRDLPLTIDPVLSYASYFGGNSGDLALAIRLGADQSIYVAGQTLSRRFPFALPPGGFQQSFRGGEGNGDAFVARFDSTGSNLVYFTYLGGRSEDGALDLAVDGNGNAYVAGFTISDNFPMANPIFRTIRGRPNPYTGVYPKDGFVTVVNPSGSGLVYSTYFGGANSDTITGIAVDAAGTAWLTGQTASTNFPVVNPLPGHRRKSGTQDGFVSALAPGGGSITFSTYFGGNRNDAGQGIAVDSQGSAYVAGYSASANLPITNAFQYGINATTNSTGALDAFVAKFNAQGTLLYSSFLGGGGNDAAYRVAVDEDGEAYLTGYSNSKQFPNTLTNLPGLTNISTPGFVNADAFLAKVGVNGAGAAELRYSAVLGGFLSDSGWDVAVTPGGEAYVVGTTASPNFPTNSTSGFLRHTNSGRTDVFVLGMAADASRLIFSGYLGGKKADYGHGIAVGPGGDVYLTGRAVSTNFPAVGSLQSRREGGNDAFIAVISPEPVLQTTVSGGNHELRWWSAIGPEYGVESSTSPTAPDWAPVVSPVNRQGGWRSVKVPVTGGPRFFRLKRD